MAQKTPVWVEVASKRAFAGSVDWPGWCRAGRTEGAALEALAAYAPRYRLALSDSRDAGSSLRGSFDAAIAITGDDLAAGAQPVGVESLDVVERIGGGPGTEFGVPSGALASDERSVDRATLERMIGVLEASWAAFDRSAARAVGLELRKGPRGGGRDLPKMIAHVAEADEAYLVQLGARSPRLDGPSAAAAAPSDSTISLRLAMIETLRARVAGTAIADPSGTRKRWSPRYFVRRAAWHALDHAWEIEDRSS